MKVAILTSPNQWFVPYAETLIEQINNSYLYFDCEDIQEGFDVIFMLSLHKIVKQDFLKKHKHNIVIHASDLPQGGVIKSAGIW